MDLTQLRQEIDRVDREMVGLFERRMEISRLIGQYKAERGLPVFDAERENQLIENRSRMLKDESLSGPLRDFYLTLMDIGKELQYRAPEINTKAPPVSHAEITAVAYQGVPGAYGEAAAKGYFGPGADYTGYARFDDVFTAVEEGRAQRGVVPVENSSTGSITQVIDLLQSRRCVIAGEKRLVIEHCLLGLPGAMLSGITEVFSHPQGLLQCDGFLDKHRDWIRTPQLNTAEAAHFVAQSKNQHYAAIASAFAGQAYGLDILARDISNSKNNLTRFLILAPAGTRTEGKKHSLSLALKHYRGSLYHALGVLSRSGLNMTSIESRPSPGRNWEYRFFIDCVENGTPADFSKLSDELAAIDVRVDHLGSYEEDSENG